MTVEFSKTAKKHIAKLDAKIKNQLKTRLILFAKNQDAASLRKHKLSGEYASYTSINISGDYRLIYREISNQHIYVIAVGTHAQLFK